MPGLDKRTSLQEWLSERHGCDIYSVHRLDMDTSGIIVYAKNRKAESNLKKQFEEHTISKTYIARLSAQGIHDGCKPLKKGDSGSIELPISSDYDERPRQKVDYCQGKPALTHYKVLSENCDGTIDIMFTPITGRTHQLRVHSAHHLGLGRPIVGDRLYGGSESRHLHLKAMSIRFIHPENREEITYSVSSSGPEYL